LEGAYVRFNNSYSKVAGGLGSSTYGTTAQETYWVRLLEYLGQEEYAREFLLGAGITTSDFEQGNVYKLITPGGIRFFNAAPVQGGGTGTPDLAVTRSSADYSYAFEYSTAGDTFGAVNFFKLKAGSGPTTEIADLTSNQTFDVMRCTDTLTVISPTGNITFDDDNAIHTASLTANKAFFEFGGADGVQAEQFIMVQHKDTWVTYQVDSITSAVLATVTVKDVIPTEKDSSDFVDNGRSSVFRVSAWSDHISLADSAGNYPYSVAFHEQRLVFGGCPKEPETVWFSKIDNNYDFRTIETDGQVLATTGITYDLGGRSYNRIRSMTSGPTLVVATDGAEWQLRPNNFGEALTPTNIRLTQETYIGSALRSLRAGSSVFFVERSGRYFRELQYDYQIDGFKAVDLNVLSDHLFKNDQILDFCYQQSPRSVFWFVTENGLLYSLTYEKERDVYSWARHETRTGDKFIAVAMMRRTNNSPEDTLQVIVDRQVGDPAASQYLVEQFTPDFRDDGSDNLKPNLWQLDCASRTPAAEGTYNTTQHTITALDQTVVPAQITLPGAAADFTGVLKNTGITKLDGANTGLFFDYTGAGNVFEIYYNDTTTPVDLRTVAASEREIISQTPIGATPTETMKFELGAHYYKAWDDVRITASGVLSASGQISSVTATEITVEGVPSGPLIPLGPLIDYTGNDVFLDEGSETWNSGGVVEPVYTGVSGLTQLAGQEVSVIVDGAYVGEATVTSGGVLNLLTDLNRVVENYLLVGYKYTPKVVTLPASMQLPTGGNTYGQRGRVSKLGMYLYNTIGLSYGQEGDSLQAVDFRKPTAPQNESPELFTGFKNDFTVDSSFDLAKETVIQQDQPYPITILSLIPEI
jgi:hypothetical protein